MEYHGKFGHTIGRIQHITIMSIIEIWYTANRLETQNVLPTLPGFQVIKRWIKYLAKLNFYYVSNVIMITWSGTQVEDYTTQDFL